MKCKNITLKLSAFATLCLTNAGIALAGGPIPPPVEVSSPSIISLTAVAVVVGIIAYKRKK